MHVCIFLPSVTKSRMLNSPMMTVDLYVPPCSCQHLLYKFGSCIIRFIQIQNTVSSWWGFPGGSVVKKITSNAGDTGDGSSIPGLGRSPGGGYSNPLQYSRLENPMGKGAWWAIVHRVTKSQTRLKQLSTHTRLPGELKLFTIMKRMSLILAIPFHLLKCTLFYSNISTQAFKSVCTVFSNLLFSTF